MVTFREFCVLVSAQETGWKLRRLCKVGDHSSGESKTRKLENNIYGKRIKSECGNDFPT